MNPVERIKQHFTNNIETTIQAADALPDVIAQNADRMLQALLNGNKIMACGNGGCGCQAQHFVSELMHRFEVDRPSLPAIALTTDGSILTAINSNPTTHQDIFAKQIYALGQPGDVLLIIASEGDSSSLIEAVNFAHEKNITVIYWTGENGGQLLNLLNENDLAVKAPSHQTNRIQECHMITLHATCEIIETTLFPGS